MVYSGKPSAACTPCKQKKIRCDEERPICGQCIKYRRECAWRFADRNDIFFQNETSAAIRRANRPQNSGRPSNTPSQSGQFSGTETTLIDNPPQAVDTAALTFYLDGMIITPSSYGRQVGHLDLLPRMYLTSAANSALVKATHSTCLAAFSIIGAETSSISRKAYEAYGESIAAIYRASKDAELRSRNETLMAILLMLVNESLLARYKTPQQQWTMHVSGAMQLILARGSTIFDDAISRRLFLVVRNFLLEGVQNQRRAIHPFFNQLEVQKLQTGPEDRLGVLTATLYSLRPRVLKAIADGLVTTDLRNQCRTLDHELERWSLEIPAEYRYTVFDSDKHQYQDAHNHRLWNNYRCCRIFASVLEYRCLQHEFGGISDGVLDTPDVVRCFQNLQLMADEISASLPNELRQVNCSPENSTPNTISQDLPGQFVQGALLAWYLVWPLYLARGILSLPELQRDWFRSRLLVIADKYRFRQASHLVHLSDVDPTTPLYLDSWDDDRIENVWEKNIEYGCGAI